MNEFHTFLSISFGSAKESSFSDLHFIVMEAHITVLMFYSVLHAVSSAKEPCARTKRFEFRQEGMSIPNEQTSFVPAEEHSFVTLDTAIPSQFSMKPGYGSKKKKS